MFDYKVITKGVIVKDLTLTTPGSRVQNLFTYSIIWLNCTKYDNQHKNILKKQFNTKKNNVKLKINMYEIFFFKKNKFKIKSIGKLISDFFIYKKDLNKIK